MSEVVSCKKPLVDIVMYCGLGCLIRDVSLYFLIAKYSNIMNDLIFNCRNNWGLKLMH